METVGLHTGSSERSAGTGRWTILGLLAIGVLISYIDRTSMSSALADKNFVREFALTSVDRGWINSAFFWSYGLVQVPMGWVADRYGVKWPYAICFALWCAATALMGAVTTLAALIVMRLLIGMAEAIVIPASYRWIRNNFDETQNGLAIGIFAMGNKFGPAIGAPIGAWLIVNHSWQFMFVATGAVGLIWLAPWLMLVQNDFPSKAELAVAKRRASSVTLPSILSSPVVWGGMITNFCYGYFTARHVGAVYLLQLRWDCHGRCARRMGGRPDHCAWQRPRLRAQVLRHRWLRGRVHGLAGRLCHDT